MKERVRIALIAAGIFAACFIISYLLITYLADLPLPLLIFIIMASNWLVVGLGFLMAFRSYFNVYSGIKEVYSKYHMNKILYDLLKVLATVEETDDIYDLILQAATEAIPKAKYGSIMMSNLGKMTFKASVGFDFTYLELIEFDIQDTALYVMTDGEMNRPIIVDDIMTIDGRIMDERVIDLFNKAGVEKVKATMSVPIVISNSVVGCISLDSDLQGAFNEHDIEALDLFALEVSKFVRLHQILDLNRTMSRYDEMTGIYNRGYCRKQIKELMSKESPFVLVSADLNNLKTVNDLHGHDVGDLLIKNFVKQVKLFLPDEVIFARYGGDEFILVFPNLSTIEATVIMEDVARFFNNYTIREVSFPLAISFCYGLVNFPDETSTYDEVLKIADNRMYRQKRVYKESNYGTLDSVDHT